MLNLNDLRFFVSAVEHGGFSAAGRALGVPKSTVSKRVGELELRLGVRLIHRTSRRFQLTDVGRVFHDHARASLIEATAAEAVVRGRGAEPGGVVRVTSTVAVAQTYLAPHLPVFARAFPAVQVQLEVSDRVVDLVQEGVDVALRSHVEPLSEQQLVQRRLASEPVILVACPQYLTEQGAPTEPAELADHDALLVDRHATTWRLAHADGSLEEVAPRPRFAANEPAALVAAARAGLGVACLPEKICRGALAGGQLARVLPGWTAGVLDTTIVMPHSRSQLPAVRALADFLVGCVGDEEADARAAPVPLLAQA